MAQQATQKDAPPDTYRVRIGKTDKEMVTAYEQWRNKFLKHRDMDEKKKAEIPFPFYRDSITLFQADKDGGRNEERWLLASQVFPSGAAPALPT